jgi:hypothetical protein
MGQGGCFSHIIRKDFTKEVTFELSFGKIWGKVPQEEEMASTEVLWLKVA